MPPPPSFLDITPIPFSRVITQAEFNGGTFGGVVNQVWFRFVTAVDIALGNYTDSGGTFTPRVNLYESDGTTLIKSVGPPSHGWYHVVLAGTYYVRITRAAGGASNFDFTVNYDTRPVDDLSFVEGDYLVNDDSGGNPVAVLIRSDGTLLRFINRFPTGETGFNLPDNTSLWEDTADTKGGGLGSLALYDSTLQYVFSTAQLFADKSPITASLTQFYAADASTFAVYGVTIADVETLLGTLPASGGIGVSAIAADHTGTILYWTEPTGNAAIHQWNLSTGVPLADLYTIPGYDTVNDSLAQTPNGNPGDIIVIADGSLVTFWFDASANTYSVIHLSAAGTLLHAYGQTPPAAVDHLARIDGSATAVSIWLYTDASGSVGRYATLDLLTGALSDFQTDLFTLGENLVQGDGVMFGPSNSCTFLRLTAGVTPPVGVAGCPQPQPLPVPGHPACAAPNPAAL